ncbi:MAG: choice-of-anchor E domain-containing protein [Planctomycetota bacterium]
MKRHMTLVMSTALLTGATFAETIEVPFETGLTFGKPVIFDIPQFDDLGGTRELLVVTLEVDAVTTGEASAENLAGGTGSVSASLQSDLRVEFPAATELPLTMPCIDSITYPNQMVGPSDGTFGSGPDFAVFGPTEFPCVFSECASSDETDLSPFVGTGTVPASVTLDGNVNVTCGCPALTGGDFEASGIIRITYSTKPVAADATGDCRVNVDDILAVINAFGDLCIQAPCPEDVNDNGVVNIDDLLAVINSFQL